MLFFFFSFLYVCPSFFLARLLKSLRIISVHLQARKYPQNTRRTIRALGINSRRCHKRRASSPRSFGRQTRFPRHREYRRGILLLLSSESRLLEHISPHRDIPLRVMSHPQSRGTDMHAVRARAFGGGVPLIRAIIVVKLHGALFGMRRE